AVDEAGVKVGAHGWMNVLPASSVVRSPPCRRRRWGGCWSFGLPPAVQDRVRGTRSRAYTRETRWRGNSESVSPSTRLRLVPPPHELRSQGGPGGYGSARAASSTSS